jgi:glucan phosphoethanolaminetransferase (alkaline phosphatase superfamily)
MRAMSLKLFRSTGHSSILSAGETHAPMHPAWMILAISAWVGFACNVALWQQLRASAPAGSGGLARALVLGTFEAAGCALALSVLGWRKTLKPAAVLILFVAALAVCAAIWGPAAAPVDDVAGHLLPSAPALPPWTELLQWHAWVTVAGLAVLPAVCLCKTRLRRLPGQRQLSANLMCMATAGAMLALSGFVLFNGFA